MRWLRGQRRTKKHSQHFEAGRKSEKKVNKALGMKDTVASGSYTGDKGDGKTDGILAEHKATQRDSMSIKYEWLNKIEHEAFMSGKLPLFTFRFINADGSPKKRGSWVAIREEDYKRLGIDDILEKDSLD